MRRLPARRPAPRCMCHECAQELRKQTSKCPICRNQVESLLHIKMYKVQYVVLCCAALCCAVLCCCLPCWRLQLRSALLEGKHTPAEARAALRPMSAPPRLL